MEKMNRTRQFERLLRWGMSRAVLRFSEFSRETYVEIGTHKFQMKQTNIYGTNEKTARCNWSRNLKDLGSLNGFSRPDSEIGVWHDREEGCRSFW